MLGGIKPQFNLSLSGCKTVCHRCHLLFLPLHQALLLALCQSPTTLAVYPPQSEQKKGAALCATPLVLLDLA